MSKLNRPAALRLHNLQVSYTQNGRPVPVLGKLSLALGQGEIVSLLGESGSGKSTIAKAMTGLLPPSAAIGGGELIVGDGAAVDLTANGVPWSKLRGRKIGLLFQDAQQALNPLLTVRAHFRESLRFHRLASSAKEADGIGVRLLAQLRFFERHVDRRRRLAHAHLDPPPHIQPLRTLYQFSLLYYTLSTM